MFLPDHLIQAAINQGDIAIVPFGPNLLQPASVDIQLGFDFCWMKKGWDLEPIDPYEGLGREEVEFRAVEYGEPFKLLPGELVLASTLQYIEISASYLCQLSGKSTLARLGLTVHTTAGFIDPGFRGQITLELENHSYRAIFLWPGMLIGQLSFARLEEPAESAYGTGSLGSHYQEQMGVRFAAPLKRI